MTAGSRHWLLLGGTLAITYDFFAVSVLLPALRDGLAATPSQLQWVVAVYGLCFGCGLLAGSRLGDRWGCERAFGLAAPAFATAGLACALAPSVELLIACRAAEGLAAALLSPQVLTLLGRDSDPRRRERGFAAYGIALGLGSGLGQLVAALLVQWNPAGLGWRASFLLNAGLAAAVALAWQGWRAPRGEADGGRPDWLGALGFALCMLALLLPLIEGRRLLWPAWLALPPLLALPGLWWLLRRQRQLAAAGRLALIDMRIFQRPFPLAIGTVGLFYCGIASFFLIVSLSLRSRFGLAIVPAALGFSVMVLAFLLPSFLVRRIAGRWGGHALVAGALLLALGHAGLAALLLAGASVAWFVAALVLPGLGLGLVMGPLIARATAAGGSGASASGVVGSAQWLGNALGVSALGTLYFALPGAQGPVAAHLVFAGLALLVASLLARWTLEGAMPPR